MTAEIRKGQATKLMMRVRPKRQRQAVMAGWNFLTLMTFRHYASLLGPDEGSNDLPTRPI